MTELVVLSVLLVTTSFVLFTALPWLIRATRELHDMAHREMEIKHPCGCAYCFAARWLDRSKTSRGGRMTRESILDRWKLWRLERLGGVPHAKLDARRVEMEKLREHNRQLENRLALLEKERNDLLARVESRAAVRGGDA